jgi:hypothetical protein
MKYIRMYAGKDGESHFEDLEMPFTKQEEWDWRSEFIKAKGVQFRESTPEYDLDFHNVPNRQWVITLEGQVDVIVGDGSQRRIGPGVVLFAEDTTGRGHKSRAVNNKPHKHLFIVLD